VEEKEISQKQLTELQQQLANARLAHKESTDKYENIIDRLQNEIDATQADIRNQCDMRVASTYEQLAAEKERAMKLEKQLEQVQNQREALRLQLEAMRGIR